MADRYSLAQQDVVNRDNRNMAEGEEGVSPMAAEINALWAAIDTGNIGISALARDVDALAKDGGHFPQDPATTTGLTFGYFGGRIWDGRSILTVAAGTIALSASSTNYVELTAAGAAVKNTTGFTTGNIPLYQIVTGAASITTVTNKKCLAYGLPNGGLTGAFFSTAAKTKEIALVLPTVSATSTFRFKAPSHTCKLTRCALVVGTTVAANDTNYWTATVTNKGNTDGSGTTAMLAAADANTSKATGGTAFTANDERLFTLHGTSANTDVAANDVIEVTLTKAAAAADIVGGSVALEFTFEN